jgi:hypothetical protein
MVSRIIFEEGANHMGKRDLKSECGDKNSICLCFDREEYLDNLFDPVSFRKIVDTQLELFPELFPAEIDQGYLMKDIRTSKKLSLPIRRITIGGTHYTIRPSFAMPYMTGYVADTEKALLLRKYGVPFWVLALIFGNDPMYWYRIGQSIGRNSVAGTTVRNPGDMPRHVAADEKHTRILGEKTYVATTVGNECVLGASVATDAGEAALKDAYAVFKDESRRVGPGYSPDTVCTDGWKATQKAWLFLFASVAIIFCFLHVFIKIRDRSKKKHKEAFRTVAAKFWECFLAENKGSFSQKIRRLAEWCANNDVPEAVSAPIEKLRENIHGYTVAYDFPGAHRTSNMLDRLMQRMDRWLFHTQYFHGTVAAAELGVRGWALIQNFAPSNPLTIIKHDGFQSPAERLNQFRYSENWLENLLISASMRGYHSVPPNPL